VKKGNRQYSYSIQRASWNSECKKGTATIGTATKANLCAT
jgi:hypothetical protein